jgi:hypothetical protein
MGKVYGIHEIELHLGVSEEAFANFLNQEYNQAFAWLGWKMALLKGDRGERAGKYAILFEIESLETRNRFDGSQGNEEWNHWYAEHKELADNLEKKFASFCVTNLAKDQAYTDYLELG